MAKKPAATVVSSNFGAALHAHVASWKEHIESLAKRRGLPPHPRQRRCVTPTPEPSCSGGGDNGPFALSMRQLAANFRIAGALPEEPVEDIVRTLPVLRPSLETTELLHEIALLTADYYDLLAAKRRVTSTGSGK